MSIKLRLIIFIFFLLQLTIATSQESSINIPFSTFESSLKNAGLSNDVINNIKSLLVKKNESLVKNQKLQNELDSKYPFQFKDDEIEAEYVNKKFIKLLSETITIEQFRKIFQPQLEYRVKRIAEEK